MCRRALGYRSGAASGEGPSGAPRGEGPSGFASGECGSGVASGDCGSGLARGDCGNGVASGDGGSGVASGDWGNGVARGDCEDAGGNVAGAAGWLPCTGICAEGDRPSMRLLADCSAAGRCGFDG